MGDKVRLNVGSKLRGGPHKRPVGLSNPSRPLASPQRETYCQMVAGGTPTKDAYRAAGFKGDSAYARWRLRHAPEVDQRINWLVNERVKAQIAASVRRPEKKKLDAKARAIRELERIAYADPRDVIEWERLPVMLPDGTIEVRDVIKPKASASLSRDAAATVKGVTTKAGNIKIEQHDKLKALDQLARLQGLYPEPEPTPPPAPSNVTLNQVNVGERSALEVAKRVAFMLGALRAAGHDPSTMSLEDLRAPAAIEQKPNSSGPSG